MTSRGVRVPEEPFVRWSNPLGSWSSLGLSISLIVLTVASAMGATPKEVICASHGLRQIPASAPMILDALPAGASVCERTRPPCRPPVSQKLLAALHRVRLFVSGMS